MSSQRIHLGGREFWSALLSTGGDHTPLYISRIPGAGRLRRWMVADSCPRDPRIGRNHPPYGGRFERRRPSWPVVRHYWYRQ